MAEEQPVRRAVALRYDQGQDAAPTVVAAGKGLVADKIVEMAKGADVPVQEDAALAESLSAVEIGTAIPEELYPVVAELLVFINRMNQQRGKDKRGASRQGGSR